MLGGSRCLWRQQDLIPAAAAKLVQVGQLLSGTVRNARESRLLDVHGGQVLFLPGTVDVARDACLKLGFLPTFCPPQCMQGLAHIVGSSGGCFQQHGGCPWST